jgi:murein DD-endopeptidase MepM/ murein hydrolase activator NlpD
MIQFINPVSGSRMIDIPGSKSIKLSPGYGTPIVSPYDGVVENVGNDSVTISHNVNNQNVYSKFSGIHRPQVGVNVPLRQGETLAYGDTTDIEYSIMDDNGRKVSVVPYFQGINPNTTTNNHTTSNYGDDDEEKKKEKNDRPKPIAGKSYIADFLSDIALTPFKVIHKPMQKGLNKLSGAKDDDSVNEEIKRIKQLLK